MPNGVAMNHTNTNYWKPVTVGTDFEMSQILQPLEPVADDVLLFFAEQPGNRHQLRRRTLILRHLRIEQA